MAVYSVMAMGNDGDPNSCGLSGNWSCRRGFISLCKETIFTEDIKMRRRERPIRYETSGAIRLGFAVAVSSEMVAYRGMKKFFIYVAEVSWICGRSLGVRRFFPLLAFPRLIFSIVFWKVSHLLVASKNGSSGLLQLFLNWGSLQRLGESAMCSFFHVELKGAPYTNLMSL